MELRNLVLEAFQATSLILVFVTLLFGIKYPKIISDMNSKIPAGEQAKKREKKRLIGSFFKHCFPQLLFYSVASYLFLPKAIIIIKQTSFSLWNFDFVLTSYMIVTIWIWSILTWSIILCIKLIKKIREYQ